MKTVTVLACKIGSIPSHISLGVTGRLSSSKAIDNGHLSFSEVEGYLTAIPRGISIKTTKVFKSCPCKKIF